ncbi:MarR family winged helix-turn-helix transcriptional regulator [Puniceibacterium confluentis]|uniref:MarR family winged helix-turn-helix transcriptional regulator n=1 Tax=Puniceibacterium confluentis TaxID=1958944 RepID=UPI0011B57B7D|nr:MarR family transcriptional regulator [Puniceibacterium confluentis]
MSDSNALAISLFSELLTADQLVRNRLTRVLPDRMEISHFSVLNHLARGGGERSPAQLARSFHVTRGAMTNTLAKLEISGYIHIRPDWDDARRKMVSISLAGTRARDAALDAITPLMTELVSELGDAKVRAALPVLRELRTKLEND